jgi:hypothetical protein
MCWITQIARPYYSNVCFRNASFLDTPDFEETTGRVSDRYLKIHVAVIRFLVFYLSSIVDD